MLVLQTLHFSSLWVESQNVCIGYIACKNLQVSGILMKEQALWLPPYQGTGSLAPPLPRNRISGSPATSYKLIILKHYYGTCNYGLQCHLEKFS